MFTAGRRLAIGGRALFGWRSGRFVLVIAHVSLEDFVAGVWGGLA